MLLRFSFTRRCSEATATTARGQTYWRVASIFSKMRPVAFSKLYYAVDRDKVDCSTRRLAFPYFAVPIPMNTIVLDIGGSALKIWTPGSTKSIKVETGDDFSGGDFVRTEGEARR